MQRAVQTVLTNKNSVYKLPQENLDYIIHAIHCVSLLKNSNLPPCI